MCKHDQFWRDCSASEYDDSDEPVGDRIIGLAAFAAALACVLVGAAL